MTPNLYLPLLVALAACSGPTTPPTASNASADVAPSGDVGIVAPNASEVAPEPASANPPAVANPSAVATPIAAFPVPFRGRWGIDAADCDPRRADNKGLITIVTDRITFYESVARPIELTASSPIRLMAELSFSGEGRNWKSRTVFELSDGGRKLIRAEESPAAPITYAKCPA